MAATPNRTAGEFLFQCECSTARCACELLIDTLTLDLEISGFNCENGAFMVCKEFIDNAVDACAKASAPRFPSLTSGIVELELSLCDKAVRVACRDTVS